MEKGGFHTILTTQLTTVRRKMMKTDKEIIKEVALIMASNGWDADKMARYWDDIMFLLDDLSIQDKKIQEELKAK